MDTVLTGRNIAPGVVVALVFISGWIVGIRRFFAPPSWRDGNGPVLDEESDDAELGFLIRVERAMRRVWRWREDP
jgi:hypothetical protein